MKTERKFRLKQGALAPLADFPLQPLLRERIKHLKCQVKGVYIGGTGGTGYHMLWFAKKPSNLDLQERLEKLERSFKALELEWDDTYDKLRRAMGRVVKSRAILEAAEENTASAVDVAPGGNGGSSQGRLLTPAQMVHQQAILKRRASMR